MIVARKNRAGEWMVYRIVTIKRRGQQWDDMRRLAGPFDNQDEALEWIKEQPK